MVDVGTDHGYLPAKLFLEGKMRSVTATDINEKPLEKARQTLERFGATGVKLILGDGLEGVTRDMADAVIIAGMGGEVMSGIISRCSFLKDSGVLLVLQPMTAASELREYLAENGFAVEKELPVCENGKIYSVMTARFCGKPYELDVVRRFIGILEPDSAEAKAYLKKQYSVCARCAECLEGITEKISEYQAFSEAAAGIKKILEERNGV